MKTLVIFLLIIMVPLPVYANMITDSVKDSVKESINDIKVGTMESIKESLVPNVNKATLGTVIVKILLVLAIGIPIMVFVAGLGEAYYPRLIKYTIVLILIRIVAEYMGG